MIKIKFESSGLFAKEFVKQKANILFYLKRILDDVAFFIKNDIFYYIFIIARRQRFNILQTLDYHAEKYELIVLNRIGSW